ncbi:HAD family hydrolase [Streptomyces sp. NPDC002817]|uniref:HAD family hydrolase n=1 Tax=Streptomyces sp. NPDC088357 TaxID=3154655 RepID=UPI003435A1ED
MADAIEDHDAVWSLLGSVRAVLFDFDGPICDLFRGASTKDTATDVKVAAREYWGTLDAEVESCEDSHGILGRLRDMYDSRHRPLDPRPLELAERIVTAQEQRAVETAEPASDVAALADLLSELGLPLVIVSNNAEQPIRAYLEQHGLDEKFVGVFGRDPKNARHMKPHPHCLERARAFLDVPFPACLMVGDQPTDLTAAQKAGTRFLGYTEDTLKAAEMKHDGADAVVLSHLPLVEIAGKLLANR